MFGGFEGETPSRQPAGRRRYLWGSNSNFGGSLGFTPLRALHRMRLFLHGRLRESSLPFPEPVTNCPLFVRLRIFLLRFRRRIDGFA